MEAAGAPLTRDSSVSPSTKPDVASNHNLPMLPPPASALQDTTSPSQPAVDSKAQRSNGDASPISAIPSHLTTPKINARIDPETPSPNTSAPNGSGPQPTSKFGADGAAPTLYIPPTSPGGPNNINDPQTPSKDARSPTESTPPGRRSVQFARPTSSGLPESTQLRRGSAPGLAEADSPAKERKPFTLLSKLKALAGPGLSPMHSRSHSAYAVGGEHMDTGGNSANISPMARREAPDYMAVHDDQSTEDDADTDAYADADAEESPVEDRGASTQRQKRKRRSRRPPDEGSQTAPTSPKSPAGRPSRLDALTSVGSSSSILRPQGPKRRATMTEIPEDRRAGVSEDEGRKMLSKDRTWRRGSAWGQSGRGLSMTTSRGENQDSVEPRRPSTLRRFTGLVSSHDGGDGTPTTPWRQRAERTSSLSAQKWRAIKSGLRMMGQRRREDNRVDHAKSAELMAELAAGTPAVLMLASMFQRDDRGNKRVPILLEQLKVRLSDSKKVETRPGGDRHQVFRIELEYGSGLTRMKWVIHRALRDFINLHLRYKVQAQGEKYKQLYGHIDATRSKLPRFPRTSFPYARALRGLGSEDEDEADEPADDETGPSATEGAASGPERSFRKRKMRQLQIRSRRSSRGAGSLPETPLPTAAEAGGIAGAIGTNAGARKETYHERQRKKLELYLQQMIRYLIFRPESNRLCKFLELSALGVRLAAEGSYHGKEGLMVIQSAKGIDFRRALNPKLFTKRHSPKWFLVRHSYIVCVDSPEEMNIYDVLLVDTDFLLNSKRKRLRDQRPKDIASTAKTKAAHPQHHVLRLANSERKVRLLAKNERQMQQFEESIRFMASNTIWSQSHRFDSFAPPRKNVFAQWLVDGRDYMWNVSRAINMARDVIYIHDWWLSPELYMRRPAAISQKWRLDRLLQRKAKEGVKVFVIVYRNINSAIPIDSSYTKFSLLDLHPNIFVQRSPNQFRQNTFFWAHHEKICVVDHTVAFVGGIDLCFGRWDTPQHTLVDDKLTGFEPSDAPKDADHCQLWPGKDYSNPRVQDFYALDKPYEEMYDRSKVPRMPWHDISMQIVGQPARDLTRHFVQRWNYVLRQRKPTRPTPFLLPPPDFNQADLEALGLDGSCEVQILRSACWWSIGTPDKTEHSIMNAYIKTIEQSEHFIYIENQFFISSCEVEGTKIENHIGDALVDRIIRASQKKEDWRCVIIIPLMPGFQNTVDSQDGTSIRLIMQCQFRSICRGEASIFGRLRAHDIEPEDYIQFYSLRTWGKIGPSKMLVTEQLYIHAKCMVVDDRIAIIGSANINERSMLGVRDSEVAAIVRDTDMLKSTMNGEPYLVGRFPHTLRMRLMREHLGLDVDEIMEDDRQKVSGKSPDNWEQGMDGIYDDEDETTSQFSHSADKETELKLISTQHKIQDDLLAKSEDMFSFNHDVDWEQANNPNLQSTRKGITEDKRVTGAREHALDLEGKGIDNMFEGDQSGTGVGRDSVVVGDREVLVANVAPEGKGTLASPLRLARGSREHSPQKSSDNAGIELPPTPPLVRNTTEELGLPQLSQLPALPATDDTDIGGPMPSSTHQIFTKEAVDKLGPVIAEMRRPYVDKDCMKDPLNDAFYLDTWHAVAENNTKLFRQVFRCMPDNEVKTWKEYKEYAAYGERLSQAQGGAKGRTRMAQEQPGKSGPPGQNVVEKIATLGPIGEKLGEVLEKPMSKTKLGNGLGLVQDWADEADHAHKEKEKTESADNTPQPSAQSGNKSNTSTDNTTDEKAALRSSSEDPPSQPPATDSPSPALPTVAEVAADPEKATRKPSPPYVGYSEALNMNSTASTSTGQQQRRRRRTGTRSSRRDFQASDDLIDMGDAEELMKMTQGNLVVWPYDWLVKEEQGGNWLYSIDQLAPLEIYN